MYMEDALDRVRPFCVTDRRDPTFCALMPATEEVSLAENKGHIVTFAGFVLAVLFSPFSDFFMEVLVKYQLCMAHLSMNIVLTLVVFVHLCEASWG